MSIRVHLTVEIEEPGGSGKTTFTKEGSRGSDQGWFTAAVTEALIAQLASPILETIGKLHGDVLEQAPDAPGITPSLREQPLTTFERGRRLGFEQGIAKSNEYTKAAEEEDLAAKKRREVPS